MQNCAYLVIKNLLAIRKSDNRNKIPQNTTQWTWLKSGSLCCLLQVCKLYISPGQSFANYHHMRLESEFLPDTVTSLLNHFGILYMRSFANLCSVSPRSCNFPHSMSVKSVFKHHQESVYVTFYTFVWNKYAPIIRQKKMQRLLNQETI